jgi:hypothetical protein
LSSGISRKVNIEPYLEYYLEYDSVASNSKYLAVKKTKRGRIAIFDFEALMSGSNNFHITTVDVSSDSFIIKISRKHCNILICQVKRQGAILMNEAQLIYITDWQAVLYDFRPKHLPKQRELTNIADDADHEASECKKLKLTER